MMNKTFLCGRLAINKDGVVKKLTLPNGGGSRSCDWTSIDMTFNEIHDDVREKFSIDPKQKSLLYDFQWQELDMDLYRTFYEYIKKHGLKFKATILYLCTSEADNTRFRKSAIPEKRKTTVTPQAKQKVPQVEADSSTSPVVIKIDDQPQFDEKPINESTLNNRLTGYLRRSSHYSFEKSLNELVDYLRNLVSRYNREDIFIQLFELVCTLHGLSSITLDRLKQQMQSSSEHQTELYFDTLDNIEKSCRSIKVLIEMNKTKLTDYNQYLIIKDGFMEFDVNFNNLRDQWVNRGKKNRASTSSSSTLISPPVKPQPLMSISTSYPNTRSSSQYHHSGKSFREKSRSPRRSSSYRESSKGSDNDKYSLFYPIFQSLEKLLAFLHRLGFSSFFRLVRLQFEELKSIRTFINLSNRRTLSDAEHMIIEIENRLKQRINDERWCKAPPSSIHQECQRSFTDVLEVMRHLKTSLRHLQSQADTITKRPSTSHRVPPSSSSTQKEFIRKKPVVKSNRHVIKMDEDESSDTSHSSIGDEVLMALAKGAYEQRPHRHK